MVWKLLMCLLLEVLVEAALLSYIIDIFIDMIL